MRVNDFYKSLILILVGFLLGGLIFLLNAPPKGNAITLSEIPTQTPIEVYITGEVAEPGLYKLEKDSRLSDLILKAGGFLDPKIDGYNLASKLYDGQHIHIKNTFEVSPSKSIEMQNIKVNINEADSITLSSLPGIGPSKAADIIQYREENGFFEKIEDILNVPGIGEFTFNQIKDLISINQIINE